MSSRIVLLLFIHAFCIAGVISVSLSNEQQEDRRLQVLGRVENLLLIDAVSDIPMLNLTNGTIIDLAQQSATRFNIEAITVDGAVGSVRFGYNTRVNFRTESTQPFAFCGMGVPLGNYLRCSVLTIGQHNVTATPYSGSWANGTKGDSFYVSFFIINSNSPTKAPTKAPAKQPTKVPTKAPTKQPTKAPTKAPTKQPTKAPTTKAPTKQPTKAPTKAPTKQPTKAPTMSPAKVPTKAPTKTPTKQPTNAPLSAAPQPALPNCTAPQFIDASWSVFNPTYPLTVKESHGLIVGDELVVFGGFVNSFSSTTNRTYSRTVTQLSGTWRRMDDMPLAIGLTHMASVLIGTKIYACGGYSGGHPGPHTPYCFIYDHSKPAGQQWARFSDLPNGGTAGAGMIFDTVRNALYYAGGGQRLTAGSEHADDVNNTWKYSLANPGAGWVASTPIPYAANHMSAVTHRDPSGQERHFFVGGQVSESEAQGNVADNVEFLAASETWVRRSSLPIARGHTAESTRAFKCGVIMAGGSIQSATTMKNRTNDVSYYDIYNNTWKSIGTLPSAGATPIVDIHADGYMYFLFGAAVRRRRIG